MSPLASRTVIATIQGCDIVLFRDAGTGEEIVEFTADLDVDCDGTGGNPFHDPCFQPDTRLHRDGHPLHAESEPYVVVPPVILQKTRGIVLGSLCEVENIARPTLPKALAVVGDSGPLRKIGEGSPALCLLLGLDPNPNHGGTDEHIIRCRIYVARPALINGIQYALQRA